MNFLGQFLGIDWESYNAWELHWGGMTGVLAALAVMLPFILWFFWTSLSRLRSRAKKAFLFGLRLAACLLLAGVLLQPRLELKNIQPLKNTLAVLLDDSRSMSIKTFPQEKSRIDLVREFLGEQAPLLKELGNRYDIDFHFMSDRLEPVPAREAAGRYQPEAVNTDFAAVFRELRRLYKDKSLQGVLLFSDGADLVQESPEPSTELAEILSGLAGPVHVFQAGSNENFRDLAIEEVEAHDFGFVNQPLKVRLVLRASGIGRKNIPVVLKEGDRILASRTVELRERNPEYAVEMEFTPGAGGKHIYSLSVPVFAGEAVESNNRWDFEVKVVRDRIRILHLNGKPSWDSRFLREVLNSNPKVDLLSFFILRSLTDDVDAPTAELSLIPFPSNLLFSDYLGSFDLVIFHNFKYHPFLDKKYLDNIRDYVQGGGAFLMVGGDLSFQEGGYDRTPVEEILPVSFRRGAETMLPGEFPVRVQEMAIHHPVLRLEEGAELNLKSWKAMPPVQGVNAGLVPRPDAVVLAQAASGKKRGGYPLLATRRVGEGRSMIIANDTSWHWHFHRVGQGGSSRYYQKFWENVIAWMTGDPETLPVTLETSKEKYREHEKVLVNFRLVGEDYNPLPGADVELVLETLPDRRELERHSLKTDAEGSGSHVFAPGREGFYAVRLSHTASRRAMTGEARFSIYSPRVEFQKPRVNPEFLQSLAELTKGTHHVLKAGLALDGVTFPNPEVEIKTRTRSLSLWNNWASFGLIFGFLVVEWWLRRKWGLS